MKFRVYDKFKGLENNKTDTLIYLQIFVPEKFALSSYIPICYLQSAMAMVIHELSQLVAVKSLEMRTRSLSRLSYLKCDQTFQAQ